MAIYTYDPKKIGKPGKDRMRFELGDTMVEKNGAMAAISDEEIEAMIAAFPNWATAKMMIVESIYRRFAFEVTTSGSGITMQLQQRAEHWRKIYEDLQKKCNGSSTPAVPGIHQSDGPPYFYAGMMNNPATGG